MGQKVKDMINLIAIQSHWEIAYLLHKTINNWDSLFQLQHIEASITTRHLFFNIYKDLVNDTREPPKIAQFDWFSISGYWTISQDRDLKLGILRDGRLVTVIKQINH